MQILFENSYNITDEIIMKIVKNIIQRHMLWACILLSTLGSVMFVFSLLPPAVPTQAVTYLACTAVTMYSFFRIPKKNLNAIKNLNTSLHGTSLPLSTVAFGEYMLATRGENKTKGEYAAVETIYILDDVIVLSLGKHAHFVVLKNSFTKGDFVQWKEFISSQCVNARYKSKKNFVLPVFSSLSKEQFINE